MKLSVRFALVLFAAAASLGMSGKPKVTVRFHSETNRNDSNSFATPVKLHYANRDAFMNKVPDFSERNIKAIFLWKNADGKWGCAFKLNDSGRIRLETLSSDNRGSAIIALIGTKQGVHQVVDMVIDRPITDGIVTIPTGITDIEMLVLKSQFPLLGAVKAKKKEEAKPQDITDWRMDPNRDTPGKKLPPLPAEAARKSKRTAAEPDLPRVAD